MKEIKLEINFKKLPKAVKNALWQIQQTIDENHENYDKYVVFVYRWESKEIDWFFNDDPEELKKNPYTNVIGYFPVKEWCIKRGKKITVFDVYAAMKAML